MIWAKRLIILMSLECLTAAAVFAYSQNWKQAIYWFFAACINATVCTF